MTSIGEISEPTDVSLCCLCITLTQVDTIYYQNEHSKYLRFWNTIHLKNTVWPHFNTEKVNYSELIGCMEGIEHVKVKWVFQILLLSNFPVLGIGMHFAHLIPSAYITDFATGKSKNTIKHFNLHVLLAPD